MQCDALQRTWSQDPMQRARSPSIGSRSRWPSTRDIHRPRFFCTTSHGVFLYHTMLYGQDLYSTIVCTVVACRRGLPWTATSPPQGHPAIPRSARPALGPPRAVPRTIVQSQNDTLPYGVRSEGGSSRICLSLESATGNKMHRCLRFRVQ